MHVRRGWWVVSQILYTLDLIAENSWFHVGLKLSEETDHWQQHGRFGNHLLDVTAGAIVILSLNDVFYKSIMLEENKLEICKQFTSFGPYPPVSYLLPEQLEEHSFYWHVSAQLPPICHIMQSERKAKKQHLFKCTQKNPALYFQSFRYYISPLG